MSEKARNYNELLLKSPKFTSSFLTAYWGERLVRAIVGCAAPSQALVTCLEKNGIMSYTFPEEYDRFIDCFERNTDPVKQEKECAPLLADVNTKVMGELEMMKQNAAPLSEAEFNKFEKCVTAKGESGLFDCALAGEDNLRSKFDSCMSANNEDLSKCQQQGSDLVIAAGKFLKRAGVQL